MTDICIFCNYEIRDISNTLRDKLTRRDLASRQFCNKWICGTCSDGLQEMLE